MAAPLDPSWAQVAEEGAAETVSPYERLEFSWKPVKKGRLRPAKSTIPTTCTEPHCQLSEEACQKSECITRIKSQLFKLRANNTSLRTAYEARRTEFDEALEDIYEHCDTVAFFAEHAEISRMTAVPLLENEPSPLSCRCVSCRLASRQQTSALLEERLSAIQRGLKVLKEFRIANEPETELHIFTQPQGTSKYFTPVGSSKAKGVVALRPKLQMQTSYNFAALTTNSMAARPLKVPKETKPKAVKASEPEHETTMKM